jgi:hypothetical protein
LSCERNRLFLIDYVEGNLDRDKVVELENHLRRCEICRGEINELIDTIGYIREESENYIVPENFMNNIKKKVKGTVSKKRRYKKSFRVAVVVAVMLTLFVTVTLASNGFKGLINYWLVGSEQQDEILNRDLSTKYLNNLSISAIDKDIKITITGVLADNMHIQIFYEIEDLKQLAKYYPISESSIIVDNPIISQMNLFTRDKYKQRGSIVLSTIGQENIVNLKFKTLKSNNIINVVVEGNWEFNIPITKYKVKEYNLDKEIMIDGHSVILEKLTVAPTVTVLKYKYYCNEEGEKFEGINRVKLITDNRIYHSKFIPIGLGQGVSEGWHTREIKLDSIYFDNTDNIGIEIEEYTVFIENKKEFKINPYKNGYQVINYLDNKISITNIKIGSPTTLQMYETLKWERKYQMLDFYFINSHNNIIPREDKITAYFISKNNKIYYYEDAWAKNMYSDGLKFLTSHHEISLLENKEKEDNIPTKLVIEGYNVIRSANKRIELETKRLD